VKGGIFLDLTPSICNEITYKCLVITHVDISLTEIGEVFKSEYTIWTCR
jgi:hypothetical protein